MVCNGKVLLNSYLMMPYISIWKCITYVCTNIISMAWCGTAVSPMLMHCRCCSLALGHRICLPDIRSAWSSSVVPLWHCHLCPKSSRGTPHGVPVRARYGVSIMSFQSDLYPAIDIVVLNEISCYIESRYGGTRRLSTIGRKWNCAKNL